MTLANPFASLLAARGRVVLDGGSATALEAAGARLDTALWSAGLLRDDPDAIERMHRAFLDAGADCITTVGYQASFDGFAAVGVGVEEAEGLMRRAVRLAQRARDGWAEASGAEPALVAASVGPFGASLGDGSEYRGDYGVERGALWAFHERRFAVLGATGADVLACETIPCRGEADVLLDLLDRTPEVWAWLSFACRDGEHLVDGTPFLDAVRACSGHERVAAVGVNCTAPRHVEPLLRAARGVTDLPLVAYANSGEMWDGSRRTWRATPGEPSWASCLDAWLATDVHILGGCCRVGPDEIRALRERVDAREADAGREGAPGARRTSVRTD